MKAFTIEYYLAIKEEAEDGDEAGKPAIGGSKESSKRAWELIAAVRSVR